MEIEGEENEIEKKNTQNFSHYNMPSFSRNYTNNGRLLCEENND